MLFCVVIGLVLLSSIANAGIEDSLVLYFSFDDGPVSEVKDLIVNIPDPNLRTVLEEALGKNPGDPITSNELATLNRLDRVHRGISDLTGLDYCVKMQQLDLSENQISDLQPLVDNPGMDAGDKLTIHYNPLSYGAINTDIPILQSRGVDVLFVNRVPAKLTKVSGDGQAGAPGSTLPDPFVVRVRDQSNAPYEGVPVTFTVTAGGGSLDVETTTTDANGLARTTLTLGPTPVIFGATSLGPPDIDEHTITATAGANGSISPSGEVKVTYGASQTILTKEINTTQHFS